MHIHMNNVFMRNHQSWGAVSRMMLYPVKNWFLESLDKYLLNATETCSRGIIGSLSATVRSYEGAAKLGHKKQPKKKTKAALGAVHILRLEQVLVCCKSVHFYI